jgi:hypothetical protein
MLAAERRNAGKSLREVSSIATMWMMTASICFSISAICSYNGLRGNNIIFMDAAFVFCIIGTTYLIGAIMFAIITFVYYRWYIYIKQLKRRYDYNKYLF